jgi:hypothetical protein
MRNSPRTVTTRETVSSWMACTSADRATAPGKYTGVPVQGCRQGHCSRQVHRRTGTGLQTGPLLQASAQMYHCRAADRATAPGKCADVSLQGQTGPALQASTQACLYRAAEIDPRATASFDKYIGAQV